VESQESGVKGQNPLPRAAGHAALDATQDTVGFLGCKHTLPAHVELLIHQYPQVLLVRAAFEPLSTQSVLVFGIAPTKSDSCGFWLGNDFLYPTKTVGGPLLSTDVGMKTNR